MSELDTTSILIALVATQALVILMFFHKPKRDNK